MDTEQSEPRAIVRDEVNWDEPIEPEPEIEPDPNTIPEGERVAERLTIAQYVDLYEQTTADIRKGKGDRTKTYYGPLHDAIAAGGRRLRPKGGES